VTAGSVVVNVDVDVVVDGRAASLTFTARLSPKHLVGPLLASQRPDVRDRVHVDVHVQVGAVRALTARPIALSRLLQTLSGLKTGEGIGRTRRNVVVNVDVDVVVDVDRDPCQAREAARTRRADCTAETAVSNPGGHGVACGVHQQVLVHVNVLDGVREAERALTTFPHTL
jgi:hypothetical protein